MHVKKTYQDDKIASVPSKSKLFPHYRLFSGCRETYSDILSRDKQKTAKQPRRLPVGQGHGCPSATTRHLMSQSQVLPY